MNFYKRNTIVILSLINIVFLSCASEKELPLEQKLQNVLDKGINKYNTNGVSAAVVFADSNKWVATSGFSHDTVSIKPDMLFAVGSITKNFIATLTLKLVEEGKLSLEDLLSKWLPEYPYINNAITIRQLLNHSSGIYMFWSNQKIWDDLNNNKSKIYTPQEVLSYIKEPYFSPGDGFRYSNTNYLLLALIITKASGLSLSDEFKKQFWQPFNLHEVYLSMEDDIPDRLAHVYGDDPNYDMTFEPRAAHESITYGSSGLFMTAEELALWSQLLFEGKILSQQFLQEMLQFITFMPTGNMCGYGLGVQLYRRQYSNGKEAYGHSGANIGTSTYMMYLPKHHLSVVVMINSMDHECSEYIIKNLVNTLLKDLNDYSIIPVFDFPLLFYVILFSLSLIIINIFRLYLKKHKTKNTQRQIK